MGSRNLASQPASQPIHLSMYASVVVRSKTHIPTPSPYQSRQYHSQPPVLPTYLLIYITAHIPTCESKNPISLYPSHPNPVIIPSQVHILLLSPVRLEGDFTVMRGGKRTGKIRYRGEKERKREGMCVCVCEGERDLKSGIRKRWRDE